MTEILRGRTPGTDPGDVPWGPSPVLLLWPGPAVVAVVAIAAIGMKTSLKSLVDMGLKPVLLAVLETLLLAAVVMGVLAWR